MEKLTLRLLVLLAGLLICRLFSPYLRKLGKWFFPLIFAYAVLWKMAMPYFSHGAEMYYLNTLHIFCSGCLLALFQRISWTRSKCLACFLLAWLYFCFACVWGEDALFGFMYYFDVLIEFILPFTAYAYWMRLNPKMWHRTLLVLSALIILIAIRYALSSDTSDLMEGTRIGLASEYLGDEQEINVNVVGLMVVSMIPWVFLSITELREKKWMIVIRAISGISLMILLGILIKTGSRNSSMMILPILLYMMSSKSNFRLYQRIVFILMFAIIVAFAAIRFVGVTYVEDVRLLKYEKGSMTTGRYYFFVEYLNRLHDSPIKTFLGGGALLDSYYLAGKTIANGHSALVQYYAQSGVLGVILFIIFTIFLVKDSRTNEFGAIARMLFLIWVFTSLGESVNINQYGYGAKAQLGFAIGLLAKGNSVPLDYYNRKRDKYIV